MNVVMIILTGIGCEIGGHCGDANAASRLLGACCENLVLHPNVVNASDLNEMPPQRAVCGRAPPGSVPVG